MAEDVSRLRQRLLATEQELHQQLQLFVSERGPLIRGSLGTRARVCGKPGCKCARGERHQSKFLSASDAGKVRQVHVPAGDEVRVTAGVERYRRFRQAQAQFAERLLDLNRRQLQLVDALGNSLLVPYPADNPLPPPKRRGRPPNKPKG